MRDIKKNASPQCVFFPRRRVYETISKVISGKNHHR